MTERSDVLNDFVVVLKSGVVFYEEAGRNISDEMHKQLFAHMTMLRKEMILELVSLIEADDDTVRVHTTFREEINKSFAHLRAKFQDKETAYLTELARLEARTVNELEACIDAAPSAKTKALLFDFLPRFRESAEVLAGLAAAA